MKRALFAANWKMNKLPGEAFSYAETFLARLRESKASEGADIVICPPAPLIPELVAVLHGSKVSVGAQNCSYLESGAHTGELSPQLLLKLGVNYVILGHSERRILYREPSSEVAKRVSKALELGLNVILCVGETKEEYEAGKSADATISQLRASLVGVSTKTNCELIIAYEPVWAIGTGLAATPQQAQGMHDLIRADLKNSGLPTTTRIIYGGSASPENIAQLTCENDIDGALPGSASLDPEKFFAIIDRGSQAFASAA